MEKYKESKFKKLTENSSEPFGILFLTIKAPFSEMKYFLTKQGGEFQIKFASSVEDPKKEGFLVTKAEASEHFHNFDWISFVDLTSQSKRASRG